MVGSLALANLRGPHSWPALWPGGARARHMTLGAREQAGWERRNDQWPPDGSITRATKSAPRPAPNGPGPSGAQWSASRNQRAGRAHYATGSP